MSTPATCARLITKLAKINVESVIRDGASQIGRGTKDQPRVGSMSTPATSTQSITKLTKKNVENVIKYLTKSVSTSEKTMESMEKYKNRTKPTVSQSTISINVGKRKRKSNILPNYTYTLREKLKKTRG